MDKRGIHWQSWEKMSVPKSNGGMGFRDLELFNDAMLDKQAWRLLENPNSLCARVLKGRYYPDVTIFYAGCPRSASPVWRPIIIGREVLKHGLVRRVGNGMTTEVWHDNWISGTRSLKPMGRLIDTPVLTVADLIEEESGEWSVQKVCEIFTAPHADAILSLPRRRSGIDDCWAWEHERSRVFSVRSAYRMLLENKGLLHNTTSSSADGDRFGKRCGSSGLCQRSDFLVADLKGLFQRMVSCIDAI
jgi:hypothetical protein